MKTATKWTLKHENETTLTQVTAPIDLRFASECGYRWVNRNDGMGWFQISWLMNRAPAPL